jgi:predicted nuclease of predicted toxin-antitoxin system
MHLLLADEDFDHRVVRLLREADHDVITILDLGLAGLAIPDEQIFAIAIAMNRCILTFNRKDFIKLHWNNPKHDGIIICTRNPDVEALFTKIAELLSENVQLNGRLLRIYRSYTK